MTIASAIAALAPNLWYKLDEASGTTATNSGSLSNDGTYSGTTTNVPGPEDGTRATRLWSGGQIISNAGMDVVGPTSTGITIGAWLSGDAGGIINTVYPIISIGDPANRLNRGVLIWESHSTMGDLTIRARWNNAGPQLSGTPAENKKHWHFYAWTFQTGTNGHKCYVDGNFISQQTLTGVVNAVSTDQLLIRCDEPMSVAHVVFWGRTLSQAELLTIGGQISTYPDAQPINTPPQTGGGGTIPPDTDAQLDRIEGYVDDVPGIVTAVEFISDTVNTISGQQLADHNLLLEIQDDVRLIKNLVEHLGEFGSDAVNSKLDDLTDFVTKAFQTAEGLTLQSPIGGLLAHPDRNLLHQTSTYFDISGRGTCPDPGPLHFSNVYGIRWETLPAPPHIGLRYGAIDETVSRLVQFAVYYRDLASPILACEEVEDFRLTGFTWYWRTYNPNQIQYDVMPGVTLRCRYILASPGP